MLYSGLLAQAMSCLEFDNFGKRYPVEEIVKLCYIALGE